MMNGNLALRLINEAPRLRLVADSVETMKEVSLVSHIQTLSPDMQSTIKRALVLYAEGMPMENIALLLDISTESVDTILDSIVPYL